MILVKKGEGRPHEVKGHSGQWGTRKIEAEKDSQRVNVILSHFLPGGGVEMSSSPRELVYYVISGSLKIKGKTGKEYILEPGDIFYIGAGEEREVQVRGTEPASILVIATKLD